MGKRIEQHLAAKLENFIPTFLSGLSTGDYKYIKDKFIVPKKDEETQLFRYDSTNSLYSILSQKASSKYLKS